MPAVHSSNAHAAIVDEPKLGVSGFRWNPYDKQHGMQLTTVTEAHFDTANYALMAAAGYKSVRLQEAPGSVIIRRTQLARPTSPLDVHRSEPTVEIFVGGLCYHAELWSLARMIKQAVNARIYDIQMIPGKNGALPTSCKIVVHRDDELRVTALDKKAIIVGAGLLVADLADASNSFDALVEKRNTALKEARQAAGLDLERSRAALRPLVFQRRYEEQVPQHAAFGKLRNQQQAQKKPQPQVHEKPRQAVKGQCRN